MILVDTSIWIDHLHSSDPALMSLLDDGKVLCHPLVIGEIAMGALRSRSKKLSELQELPMVVVADHEEVLRLVAQRSLHGLGIGYIDAHLLAAAQLTQDARLWTRDKRLHRVALTLHLAWTKQLLH